MKLFEFVLFQSKYPPLEIMYAKISTTKSEIPPLILIQDLNVPELFLELSYVNLEIRNCHDSILSLIVRNSQTVKINNCTFGNWILNTVPDVVITNCSKTSYDDLLTSLRFNSSSASMKNISIKNMSATNSSSEVISLNNSNVEMINFYFVNNHGTIKITNSSNVTITGVSVQNNSGEGSDGAFYIDKSKVTFINTIFNKNRALRAGGAIYATNYSYLLIKNSTFENNHVTSIGDKPSFGGAIYLRNFSTIKVVNSNFTNNTAPQRAIDIWKRTYMENITTGSFGGAIGLQNSKVHISNSVFEHNAAHAGGVISIANSSLNIYHSVFTQNSAAVTGGVIVSSQSRVDIFHSRIFDNSVMLGGILGFTQLSTIIIQNCNFTNNKNTTVMFVIDCNASIVESLFLQNSVPHLSGAIFSHGLNFLNINKTRFTLNKGIVGGAIFVMNQTVMRLSECIFTENSAIQVPSRFYPYNIKLSAGLGGAIAFYQSVLSLTQCKFQHNSAYVGGAIHLDNSTAWMHQTNFTNNECVIAGGALFISPLTFIVLQDSFVVNNTVLGTKGGAGGGLHILNNCTANLSNIHFEDNKSQHGAAIFAGKMCKVTISKNTFTNNSGSVITLENNVTSEMKICLFVSNGNEGNNLDSVVSITSHCNVTISRTTFSNNTVQGNGGVIGIEKSNASFYNCLFNNNFGHKGGALSSKNSIVQFKDCTFSQNHALNGGVFATNDNIFMENCLVWNNSAGGDGGVAYLEQNSRVNIISSEFSGNSAGGSGGVIWMRNAFGYIQKSSFSDNRAVLNGGVIDASDACVINITQTKFISNTGGKSGVLFGRKKTKISLWATKMIENSASNCGIILIDEISTLEMYDSQIGENYGGSLLCVYNNSLSIIQTTSFTNSTELSTSLVDITESTLFLEHCSLKNNRGEFGTGIYSSSSELRFSHTLFSNTGAPDILLIDHTGHNSDVYTYNCTFRRHNITVYSNVTKANQNFLKEKFLLNTSSITLNRTDFIMEETPFASCKYSFDYIS